MNARIEVAKLPEFDISEMMQSERDIAEYLNVVIAHGDAALLAATVGDIARARGMTQIARDSGIGREALYKALRPNTSPRFDTIARVCKALGVKLAVLPDTQSTQDNA